MKDNFKFQSNFKLHQLLGKVITLAFEYNWILRSKEVQTFLGGK